MNKQNQLKLAAFFDEIAEGELAVDLLKSELNAAKGFSANALFDHIAQGATTISIDQLTQYLERKFNVNERQVYTLFERFDGSREGVIVRDDFIRELSPQTNARRVSNNITKVTAEVEALFVSLAKEYIDRERILDICRKDLEGIPPYYAFDEVAIDQKGFLGLGELKDFMKKCDMPLKDDLLALVMHGLKRRHYRFITLQVFCENLWPLEFGYYKSFEEHQKEHGEEQYLKRSRLEDEDAERKRVDKQRIQAQIKKNQRRMQAEVEKNIQTERELRHQISRDMDAQARISRRAELEAEKMTRWSAEKDDILIHEEARLAELARIRRLQAEAAKRNQEGIALQLERNARANIYDIEASRRQIDLERQAFQREAYLQDEVRADIERHRATRIAREAEEERLRLRDEALREQERGLIFERQRAREALVRRELEYDKIRPLHPAPVVSATPPRFNYTANNYEVPRKEGHITSVSNPYSRTAANSYSYSAAKPAATTNLVPPPPRISNYAYSATRPQINSTTVVPSVPATAVKYDKDRSLPATAEDSRKKVTFGDRDLKKSYIV